MSYDGGLSIKVVNSELLKILKDNLKKGTFDGVDPIPHWIGTKHKRMTTAIDYEYWDCAYINVCPKKLTQVLECVIKWFDMFEDDIADRSAYKSFKDELRNNAAKINESYKYVEWIYAHDDGDDCEETFRFEKGVESYEKEQLPIHELFKAQHCDIASEENGVALIGCAGAAICNKEI